MKCVVLAYHNMGCAGIKALLDAGFEILAVFTHRDDPGENIWFDSVAQLAVSKAVPVYAPEDINHPVWVKRIKKMAPDFIFSFYYRNILKQELLDLPPRGAVNLHGSLLPKYRGRAPINWALINGEKETGVTLHYMTAKADAGDIIAQGKVAVCESDTARSLFDKCVAAAQEMLAETLPLLKEGKAERFPQDHSQATVFGGRKPTDGEIVWSKSAVAVRNLIRAVTRPYPGAFSFLGGRKFFFWAAEVTENPSGASPGTVLSVSPLTVACGERAIKILSGEMENGVFQTGVQLAAEARIVPGMIFHAAPQKLKCSSRPQRVLILGVNGFIGSHISEKLLQNGYEVWGLDLHDNCISHLLNSKGFHFREGDISIHREWIEYHIRKCDIVLPLAAVATPIEYTRDPLRVFELDFEENLRIVRHCVKYNKRIIFPSTSEVYGMCEDPRFDEENSKLVTGPIRMQRWIYATSKQLLDRVIWAYGAKEGLRFTLFRPFNWIGPRLDSLTGARTGSSRVITQLILDLVQGSPIQLIDGGEQKRCFLDIKEGIEALFRIIENKDGICDGKIINIGNPDNEITIREMAEMLAEKFEKHKLRSQFPPFAGFLEVESGSFYGKGYQDVQHRVPSIRNAKKFLDWTPSIKLEHSIETTLDFFLREAVNSGEFKF